VACLGEDPSGLQTGSPVGSTIPLISFTEVERASEGQAAHVVRGAMFDLAGVNTTAETHPDAAGLTVGRDKPLRHAGTLFEGQDTKITTKEVVRVDTALLEATLPVLRLISSKMTVQNDVVNLANNAKFVLHDNSSINAIVSLSGSALRIANGSLANINNSFMLINGFLFSLANNSTLNLGNGAFATVINGGVLSLTGSLGFLGAGTNTANIVTTPGAAGHIVTNIPNLVGVPVALLNGASAAQVSVANGFQAFQGQSGSNTVSFGPNAAALVVNGPAAKVNLKPAP